MNYNYSVRSIAVLLHVVHNLTFEFKGGSGGSPPKICKNWYKFLQF